MIYMIMEIELVSKRAPLQNSVNEQSYYNLLYVCSRYRLFSSKICAYIQFHAIVQATLLNSVIIGLQEFTS